MLGRWRKNKKNKQYVWNRPTEYKGRTKKGGSTHTAFLHIYTATDVIVVGTQPKYRILKIKVRARIMKSIPSEDTTMIEHTWIITPTKAAAKKCLLAVADWFIQNSFPTSQAHDITGDALYQLELDL